MTMKLLERRVLDRKIEDSESLFRSNISLPWNLAEEPPDHTLWRIYQYMDAVDLHPGWVLRNPVIEVLKRAL